MEDEPMVRRRAVEALGQVAPLARLPLLYHTLTPLSAEHHGRLRLTGERDFGFATGVNAIPLTVDEFPQAMRSYPIAIASGDNPLPVALVGFEAGRNDHVDAEGGWSQGAYVPAYVRRYPFCLLKESQESDRNILCADLSSTLLTEAPGVGTPLFAAGKPSDRLRAILDFCNRFEVAMQRTRAVMAEARDLGLIGASAVTVTRGERSLRVEGFSIVVEERLRELPDARLAGLARRGVLGLFTAHQLSTVNFSGFGKV
jgi:hypothetical protein